VGGGGGGGETQTLFDISLDSCYVSHDSCMLDLTDSCVASLTSLYDALSCLDMSHDSCIRDMSHD